MYNRYVPQDMPFSPVGPYEQPSAGEKKEDAGLWAGILRMFGMEKIDSGDILLLLILLFLAREGEDMEVLITLGIALLMGRADTDSQME